jgi:hypothetical protein
MIRYPMTVQRALTDDLSRLAKPAEGSSWDETYTREAEALLYYDSLANPIGIYRHPDKGRILLPPNAPDPHPDHPLLTLTKVSRRAERLAGGYVGPDDSSQEQILLRTDLATRRVHATTRMASTNPQSAIKLLAYAAQHTLDYLWGVTPTRLTTLARERFEAAIRLAMDTILCPAAFDAPEVHITRYKRAHRLLQVPTRFGGASLTSQHPLAAAAFLSTTATVLKDPLVFNLRHLLFKDVDKAYTLLYSCFTGLDRVAASGLLKGFPSDAASLFTAFLTNDLHTPPTRRLLQKQLTGSVATHQRTDLRETCDHRKIDPQPGTSLPV